MEWHRQADLLLSSFDPCYRPKVIVFDLDFTVRFFSFPLLRPYVNLIFFLSYGQHTLLSIPYLHIFH
jgi:hypothetical protein